MKKLMLLVACLLVACGQSEKKSGANNDRNYDATLSDVKPSAGNHYITWKSDERWPNDSRNLSGEIVINGVACEYIRSGYRRQHLSNVYGRGSRHVSIKRGQTVELYIRSTVGNKRTNPVQFVWPWEDTK